MEKNIKMLLKDIMQIHLKNKGGPKVPFYGVNYSI